jgi:uncharacterized HAD superfamily protein
MRLGIDFDGTITDAAAMQRAYARKRWDVELGELEVMRGGAVPILGADRYRAMGDALWGPLTAFTVEQADAVDTLGRLVAQHEVTIVTARTDSEAAFARRWLNVRGLPVSVVNTSAKPKVRISGLLGLDVLFDDDITHQAVQLHAHGTLPVLYLQAHNRDHERPEGMRTVEGWGDFETLVSELDP